MNATQALLGCETLWVKVPHDHHSIGNRCAILSEFPARWNFLA